MQMRMWNGSLELELSSRIRKKYWRTRVVGRSEIKARPVQSFLTVLVKDDIEPF